jgi:hypothetical protein
MICNRKKESGYPKEIQTTSDEERSYSHTNTRNLLRYVSSIHSRYSRCLLAGMDGMGQSLPTETDDGIA